MSRLFRETLCQRANKMIIPTNWKQFIFTCVHCYSKLSPFPRPLSIVICAGTQNKEESWCPRLSRCFLYWHNVCAHESMWCRSTLNTSTSPLPIMHCGKGNTHFVYLEEVRDGNYQPEERRGNQTKAKRTGKSLCLDCPRSIWASWCFFQSKCIL